MKPRLRSLSLVLALLALVGSALPAMAQREKLTPQDLAVVQSKWPNAKKTITGLRYVLLEQGKGAPAAAGDVVSVAYTGMLLDGTVFNKFPNPENPKPFSFRLGRGAVIDGWDQGLKLLSEGGKMILIVPYELAYGTLGNPPVIPRQATLVFEIEMVKIERAAPPPQEPVKDTKRKTKKYEAAPFTKKDN